jgi:hypothetical protein
MGNKKALVVDEGCSQAFGATRQAVCKLRRPQERPRIMERIIGMASEVIRGLCTTFGPEPSTVPFAFRPSACVGLTSAEEAALTLRLGRAMVGRMNASVRRMCCCRTKPGSERRRSPSA